MVNPPNVPIAIAADVLPQLKVAEIKDELFMRKVNFPSKLRKQALLDLLKTSLHLPVVQGTNEREKVKPKKGTGSKCQCWRTDDPVRKILYFEFKEGNIPIDPNEMGPAEIYCKFHKTPEFDGIQYDDTFVQRLKSLRQHVMKEEPLLKWSELHPARKLLFDEISDGRIPLEADRMGAAQVWCNYHSTSQFKMRGMKFGDTFKRRLTALRMQIGKDKSRAAGDQQEVARAIRNHPAPTHNHRGEPQWNGSKAQQTLKLDIAAGNHLKMTPTELWLDPARPEYQDFEPQTFRWKIQQELKTQKYLHTLKHDAEQKLRKNLKKMTIE